MKNNRILIIAIVVLTIVVSYFIYTSDSRTLRGELSDFAVEDTAAIDKIFLADKLGHTSLLTRVSSTEWKIGEFVARQDAINNLLFTLKKMTVKAPVAKSMQSKVLKDMSGIGQRKIEIYSGGRLLKTIFVGVETMDKMGTYMLIEGSTVPFEVHIRGHRGFLQGRFITDDRLWRDPVIFRYDYRDIRKVAVSYPELPQQNYAVLYDGKKPSLEVAGKPVAADSLALYEYLNAYKNVVYEYIVSETFPEATKDSILMSRPFVQISVTDKAGKTTAIQGFRRAAGPEETDPEGKPLKYDLDRMYGYLNGKDFLLVQYFQFDRLLKEPASFVSTSK